MYINILYTTETFIFTGKRFSWSNKFLFEFVSENFPNDFFISDGFRNQLLVESADCRS